MQERNLGERNSIVILLPEINIATSSQVAILQDVTHSLPSICSKNFFVSGMMQVYIVDRYKVADLQDVLAPNSKPSPIESFTAVAEHNLIDQVRLRHILVERFTETDLKDL
jgi:hypothetical protein